MNYINIDKFVVDNADMSNFDFENVFVENRDFFFDNNLIIGLEGEDMEIILATGVIIDTGNIMLNIMEIWVQLS